VKKPSMRPFEKFQKTKQEIETKICSPVVRILYGIVGGFVMV
jgi:hypothetical protein